MHAWVTALSEIIAETEASGGGGSGGGDGGGGGGGAGHGGGGAIAGPVTSVSGSGVVGPQQQQIRRFMGALERAGLCGPLGGPAIPAVPGAVWENPAFVDLLAGAMLTKAASERRHNALATGASDSALRPLVKSSTEVGRALGQLMMSTTHERRWRSRRRVQALVGLGDLALGCPAGTCDNQRFLGWLGQIVERVRNIPRGRCLLLPRWVVYENRWSSDGLRGSSQRITRTP